MYLRIAPISAPVAPSHGYFGVMKAVRPTPPFNATEQCLYGVSASVITLLIYRVTLYSSDVLASEQPLNEMHGCRLDWGQRGACITHKGKGWGYSRRKLAG